MTARSFKPEIILVSITLCLFSLMLFLNDVNLHIRIKELKIYMQKSNREDNNIDHIGLVMKYRLQKRIYENQLNQDEADINEARVNSILSRSITDQNVTIGRYQLISIPSLYIINLFRKITNKDPIQNISDDAANKHLAIAYYYERNNCFDRALNIYESALKVETYNKNTMASIILHEGYCHSILGNYHVAREKYLSVIKKFSDKPVAITALILLKYLDGFKTELDRVLGSEKDTIEKSEKLTRLIAYREALNVITKIEDKSRPADRSRIMYIKGMCFEGLSEKEKAIDTYQNIITQNSRSPYAKLANRRIYISGCLANNGEKLKELAAGNNAVIKDSVFDKMTDQEKKLGLSEQRDNAALLQKELEKEESKYPVLNIEKLKLTDISKTETPAVKEETSTNNVRISTIDGDIFIGTIQQKTGEFIIVETMVGSVKIPKNKIDKIVKLKE